MIKTTISLVAFPDELCVIERVDLRILMQRAQRIETRLEKGVNVEDEYRRYQVYCDRLEYYAVMLAADDRAMYFELGSDYLEILLDIEKRDLESARKARIFSNFCPSDMVANRIEWFEELTNHLGLARLETVKKKIEFYKAAASRHYSVVEIHEITADQNNVRVVDSNTLKKFDSLSIRDDVVNVDDMNVYEALRQQFLRAIRNQKAGIQASVNFSDLGHHVITEILHEFIYGDKQPRSIPVIYGDGSEARPIQINYLRIKSADELRRISKLPIIKFGMMTQRHQELDAKVNSYWFRNQELSTGKRAAEIDELAYQETKSLLAQMRNEGDYRIAFYQTGFQPVVVGFYRALSEELYFRNKKFPIIEVTPYYFLVDNYRKGTIWV